MIDNVFRGLGLGFNDLFCLFIVLIAFISFSKLHKDVKRNIKDLENFINSLDKLEGTLTEKIMAVNRNGYLKSNQYLQGLWYKYVDTIKNISMHDRLIDISNYFNITTIIYIPGKRKIAEMVPGVLTALGILGTFLGLLQGITGLDTGSSEILRESITELLDGMSLAFTTSIVGIVSSIFWSWIDRRRYKEYVKVLNDFQIKFSQKFPLANTQGFLYEILELQKEQTEAIKHISTDISLELSKAFDKTINETLLPGLVESLSSIIEKDILPSIELVSSVVNDFANVATANQTHGMAKIVDKFIENMNNALDNQFDNLAQTIEELCEWQLETKDSLDELIKELKETTLNQKEINVSTEEMIKQFSEYFTQLIKANNDLTINIKEVSSLLNTLEELIAYNKGIATDIEEKRKIFDERADKHSEFIKNNIDKLNDSWENTYNVFNTVNDRLENSAKEFSNNIHEGLLLTFEDFDKNLSIISNRLSGTISEVNDTIDEIPGIIAKGLKGLISSISEVRDAINKLPDIINGLKDNIKSA